MRRGWRYATGESDSNWGDLTPTDRDYHILYVPVGNSGARAAEDVVRLYRTGLLVVVGTNKTTTMETIATLRASSEGEREDAEHTLDDPRLAGSPPWLRGR